MRLIRARFEGFRLLDGIDFEFSNDPDKNITVIRAANESGKTTMLTALQWCLFGEDALPSGYSPHSMDKKPGELSDTVCEVIYEVSGKTGAKRFRLIRSLTEHVGSAVRSRSVPQLYEILPSGAKEVPNVEAHLAVHMPGELREVFFTDGDRALSFIEGLRTEQQRRVKKAIEQLMGLPMLEEAVDHVKKVERDVRAKADAAAGSDELRRIRVELESIDQSIPELEGKLKEAQEEIANLTDLHTKADRELQEALKRGNREEIAIELARAQKQRIASEGRIRAAELRQAALLSSKGFAREMLGDKFRAAGALLDDLRKKGAIPNKTIPILEDRLQHSDCICGESLDAAQTDGARRRAHIQQLIEDSRDADALKSKVSDLYFEGRELFIPAASTWIDEYTAAFGDRNNEQRTYEELGQAEADLEARLDKVKDDNVQRARDMRDTYRQRLDEKIPLAARLDHQIRDRRERRVELDRKFQALSAREDKARRFTCELVVARDIRGVVERALEIMKTREVEAVSQKMNQYFRRMIGAHPDNALIQRAEITPEFHIVVHGRNDKKLDPSMDLNGASRRALTIAFVLALTEVSGVEAPNVIDTPLGMMSGFVKTEVVRVASEASSQLILFLTHDEINGCEAILDARAGKVLTITNPMHYPRMLKNDPGTTDARAIQCACDHRSVCDECERLPAGAAELEAA
ncbi:AAA family ATPase [Sphingomonas sp. VDB2]|uniref:AAA family ATPase n=1 Tax=Sphingomonas sp. VDB2 TaxID=3228751 RepID=UPI003A8051E5